MNKIIQNDYREFFTKGIMVNNMLDSKAVFPFIKQFREKFISVELIRIGGENDGGYLVPNIMNSISNCFSPGVDDNAQFEKQLSKDYDIKSFMADASIDSLPLSDSNFYFKKKFLGIKDNNQFITLNSWISNNTHKNDRDLLLQMDIEGSEYEVLTYESIEILKRFSCMVIEFHNFEKIFDLYFHKMVSGIFEKIYSEFSICHVHPNNCCGVMSYGGIDVPRIIEVTFIRNDKIEEVKSNCTINLPHRLDRVNLTNIPVLDMPVEWWKKDNIQ